MDLNIKTILKEYPLRIALTDYCNLQCAFCSNEGMGRCKKNSNHIDFRLLKKLLTILRKEGLEKIALTGGEPSLYPEIVDLLEHINKLKFKQTFFHTNGILLNERIISSLSNFSKIAVSVHSFQYTEWHKITGGTKEQFIQLIKNLDSIALLKTFPLVEIKHIPLKGINSSKKSIKRTLDYCSKKGFKFKFLICEPIIKEDLNKVVSLKTIRKRLEFLGCKVIPQEKNFRGQKRYNPIFWFMYKNVKGVLIEIGCGKKTPCGFCYKTNEIFITPQLELKPCHLSNLKYSLKEDIVLGKSARLLEKIYNSRLFLFNYPKKRRSFWEDE